MAGAAAASRQHPAEVPRPAAAVLPLPGAAASPPDPPPVSPPRPPCRPACRSAELLLAEGTVPMYYQGVKYNIPVAVWLPEQYPLAAPMAYVVPSPDMVIKPRHRFVDGSGGRWADKGWCNSGGVLTALGLGWQLLAALRVSP
jgi:hypothetical protein